MPGSQQLRLFGWPAGWCAYERHCPACIHPMFSTAIGRYARTGSWFAVSLQDTSAIALDVWSSDARHAAVTVDAEG
jgi:hypothetical protein